MTPLIQIKIVGTRAILTDVTNGAHTAIECAHPPTLFDAIDAELEAYTAAHHPSTPLPATPPALIYA